MHLLLLHGFTSHPVLTLGPLSERLKEAGWEVRQPALPGHGTRPEDLLKVRFQDWLLAAEEAEAAREAKLALRTEPYKQRFGFLPA